MLAAKEILDTVTPLASVTGVQGRGGGGPLSSTGGGVLPVVAPLARSPMKDTANLANFSFVEER